MKTTQGNTTNNIWINDDSSRIESVSSNDMTQNSNTSTSSSFAEDMVILPRDEIRKALTRVNGDVLADLDGSIKKQATASFIQLAKDDETAALSLFQELMRDGNIAAVELAKHVSRDKSINMQFKRDMKDALKLIKDKLTSRRREIEALGTESVAHSNTHQTRLISKREKQNKGIIR